MNDSILDNFAGRISGKGPVHDNTPDEEPEDLVAFGWLRGSKERATMLEIRRRDGSITALGYAWLERADFDGDTITLKFTGQTVRLTGRNLNCATRPKKLYLGLTRHRIPWLQEADEPMVMTAPKDATVIEQVEFR